MSSGNWLEGPGWGCSVAGTGAGWEGEAGRYCVGGVFSCPLSWNRFWAGWEGGGMRESVCCLWAYWIDWIVAVGLFCFCLFFSASKVALYAVEFGFSLHDSIV